MAQKVYTVARHHIGDKDYAPRDKRVADEHDVAHLVAKGVLIENKAEVALDHKTVDDEAAAAADKAAQVERLAAEQAAAAEAQRVADDAAKADADKAAKKAKA